MEMTIEERSLELMREERNQKNSITSFIMFLKLMSMKEPAYKRLGIEISNTQSDNTNSRISVELIIMIYSCVLIICFA
jgi:cell division protein FtsZ